MLHPEQARRFLAACREDRHGVLFGVAITTGMRPSEYTALKWSDIDFEKGAASICRSLESLPGGGWRFADVKKKRSWRVIKLHSNVVASLRAHKVEQADGRLKAGAGWIDHDLVFTSATGCVVDRRNLAQRNFARILKAAGLPAIRLYDLRHTAATLAESAGVPVKVVSEMLGHPSAALTLDVYSHVLPHMQDDAAAKVEALLMMDQPSVAPETGNRHTTGTQTVQ